MFGYIYKTTHKDTGRIYIGQNRGKFNCHYLGSGKHLKLAIAKYGKPAFKIELIAFVSNQEELDSIEKKYIAEYRKLMGDDNVFNIAEGGLRGIILNGKNNPMYGSERIGKLNPNWKGGICSTPNYCIDCGKNIHLYSKRCKSCVGKLIPKERLSNIAKMRISSWNKGLTKENNPVIARISKLKKGHKPWNKGLKVNNGCRCVAIPVMEDALV